MHQLIQRNQETSTNQFRRIANISKLLQLFPGSFKASILSKLHSFQRFNFNYSRALIISKKVQSIQDNSASIISKKLQLPSILKRNLQKNLQNESSKTSIPINHFADSAGLRLASSWSVEGDQGVWGCVILIRRQDQPDCYIP